MSRAALESDLTTEYLGLLEPAMMQGGVWEPGNPAGFPLD